MNRVAVFGRGGAGKSTFSQRLGDITGLPVVHLDKIYWNDNLDILTNDEWTSRQLNVINEEQWIIDGDLGPYDVVAPRIERADTVVILDMSLAVCAWRALRRGRQRIDFWVWVITWRRKYRPGILATIQSRSPQADIVTLSRSRTVEEWITDVAARQQH